MVPHNLMFDIYVPHLNIQKKFQTTSLQLLQHVFFNHIHTFSKIPNFLSFSTPHVWFNSKPSTNSHYKKLCLPKPFSPTTRALKQLIYIYVATIPWKYDLDIQI